MSHCLWYPTLPENWWARYIHHKTDRLGLKWPHQARSASTNEISVSCHPCDIRNHKGSQFIQDPELLGFCIIDSLHWEKFPPISLAEDAISSISIGTHNVWEAAGALAEGDRRSWIVFSQSWNVRWQERGRERERGRGATKPDQMALKTDAGRGQKSHLTYRNLTECTHNRVLNCSVLIGCQGCVMYGSSCPLCLYLLDSLQQDSS